jgi:glycerol dehydrogenase
MSPPLAILGAPRRYVQGPGALDRVDEFAGELGQMPFVVADPVALDLLGSRLRAGLGDRARVASFAGHCSHAEIERLTLSCREAAGDVVIGFGGGKAIDTAKGVARNCRLPIVIVPTIASNDAPTSRLIVVYDEDDAIAEVLTLTFNPDVVLVDTAVISAAPVRFFIAGIGDAISKKFEVERAVAAGGLNFFKGRPCHATLTLADSCYGEIRAHGVSAVAAVGSGAVTEAVERVTEATILLSGLGFESGGLAAAHALTRGFTALSETKSALHGEMVAFGLLVQLVLEDRSAEFLAELLGFYRAIGLPCTLRALGLADADPAKLRAIATPSCRAPYIGNMPGTIDEARLIAALRRADAIGRGEA